MSTVSIIMAVYNGEPFIAEAIGSVIDQSYPDWELVVVDDGSTDKTSHIVHGFGDSRIRYTWQENRGLAGALNRGLELARGTYITTLDADDWLTPNSLSDRVRFLDRRPELGVVYADGYYCDPSGKPVLRISEYCPRSPATDVYEDLIVSCFLGAGASVMMRRDVLERHQLSFDESLGWIPDWDFYIRLAAHAGYGALDSDSVRYRIHGTNMTLVMPEGGRLQSLVHTRFKVLESDRFASVSDGAKARFFYCLLVDDLAGRVADQASIIEGPQFRTLPAEDRARLLRLTAIGCLLRGESDETARGWLRAAWTLAPLDPKVVALMLMANVSVFVTRWIVTQWRRSRQRYALQSPFEAAYGPA